MKSGNIIMSVVGVLILLGIIYLIVQANKKSKIANAAVASGASTSTAAAIANSSNPEAAARIAGFDSTSASLISSGIATNKPKWVWPEGGAGCPEGYGMVTGGADKGWCKLTAAAGE